MSSVIDPFAEDRFAGLPPYAFPRLRALLDAHTPGGDGTIINLSIGEPKHPFPAFVGPILQEALSGFNKYPPNQGSPAWQQAVASWLTRRFNLPDGLIDPAKHLIPLNGTREGLFQTATAFVPVADQSGRKPLVLMPNPFYQCYAGAARGAGAEPVMLDATKQTGFLPDLDALTDDMLADTALFYLCTPANPQGAVADRAYLEKLITLARTHKFIVALDECYCEIYDTDAPAGGLDVAWSMNESFANVLVFHSLSKRSNLPGLRSGFVAGDPDLIARFNKVRSYGGAPTPLPIDAVATAAWSDEAHVELNRTLYREKFDIAERILGPTFGFERPAGGFFVWLDVGDSESACLRLWQQAGLRTIPGAYFAYDRADGSNPGAQYLRIALVDDAQTIDHALTKLVEVLA